MKKVFTLIIALITVISVSAYDFQDGGIYYNITSGNTVEVTSGDSKYDGNIVIPEEVTYNNSQYSVTSIGEQAFSGCSGLTSISIGNSITSIRYAAFFGCTGLTKVEISSLESWCKIFFDDISTNPLCYAHNLYLNGEEVKDLVIPDSVTEIGNWAFAWCYSLTSVEIPTSVTSIGTQAFYSCWGLTKVEISDLEAWCKIFFDGASTNPLYYAQHLYLNSEEVKDLVIPDSFTEIGNYAFSQCIGLTSVEIPNSLTSIGEDAFYGCSGLTKVEIHDLEAWCKIKFSSEGSNPLFDAGHLYLNGEEVKDLVIPDAVTSIGKAAFARCTGLTSIEIPNSVTLIGDSAFGGCSSLTSVTMGNSVTSIGSRAFEGCSGLTSIEIGNSVTSIGEAAFEGCSGLTSIEIPNSVTSIGEVVFWNCQSLTSVIIGNSVSAIGEDAFHYCPIESLKIDCPNISNWFSNFPTLKNLTIGDYVTSIGSHAFLGCSGLTSVEIPNSVTEIGDWAFADCTGLTSIEIPNSVISIGESAFAGCKSLSSVGIGNSVAKIGDYAFMNCEGLTSVEIPTSVKSIGEGTFYKCTGLKIIEIPNSVTSIEYGAFAGCTGLTNVIIPNSITSIGSYAFSGCESLTEMELPSEIDYLADGLFQHCISLEKVKYSGNVTSFGSGVFFNCPSLRSVNIPNGVTAIPQYFLAYSTSITEIRLPNSVETISNGAFYGCSSLMNVVLGTGIYDIANEAFEGCDNISDIYCMATIPPHAYENTFPVPSYTDATLYVQEQSLSKYASQDPWQRFTRVDTMNSGIQLSHYEVNMAGNQVFQLGVYGTDNKVTWTASNPDVAYVNECGLVVGRGVTGSSIITATVDGVSVSCQVNIISPSQAKGARATEDEIEPVDIIIESIGGNPPMVNARLVPVGSKTEIDWSTSDDSIATVEDGLVTIIGEGEVDFGAATGNGIEDSYDTDTKDIEVSVGVGVITEEANYPNDIYNIQGICIKRNATQSDIDALAPGLYIIGGKKVLVK